MATFSLKRKQFGKFSEFVKRSGKKITDAKIISNKTSENIVSRAWKSGASGKARVLGVGASLGTVGLSTASLLGKRSNNDGKKNQ